MSQLAILFLLALGGTTAIVAYARMKDFADLHSVHITEVPINAVPQSVVVPQDVVAPHDIAMPQTRPRIPIVNIRPVIVPEPPMQSYPRTTRTVPIFTVMPFRNRYGNSL